MFSIRAAQLTAWSGVQGRGGEGSPLQARPRPGFFSVQMQGLPAGVSWGGLRGLPLPPRAALRFSASSESVLPTAPRRTSPSTVCWGCPPRRSSLWVGPPRSTKPSARWVGADPGGWGMGAGGQGKGKGE